MFNIDDVIRDESRYVLARRNGGKPDDYHATMKNIDLIPDLEDSIMLACLKCKPCRDSSSSATPNQKQ